jgi:hypothetical protein
VGVTETRHVTVCSFPRARATTIGGSGGALTSVSSATAVVKLGEAPPGDESTWEAAQQRGDSATLNSGCGLVFALRGGGSPRKAFIGEELQHVAQGLLPKSIPNLKLEPTILFRFEKGIKINLVMIPKPNSMKSIVSMA